MATKLEQKPHGALGFELRGTLGWVWNVFGPFLGLLLITLLFAALTRESGRFITLENWQTIAVQSVIVATAALGMTIIMIAGGIDLSVGSTVALVTVCIALVVKKVDPSLPDWLREWKVLMPIALRARDRCRRNLRRDQWCADRLASGCAVHRDPGNIHDLSRAGQVAGLEHGGVCAR